MEKCAVVFICNGLSDESCVLQGREQSSTLRIIKKDLPTELCLSQFCCCKISYLCGIGRIQTIQAGNCFNLLQCI